MKHDYGILFAWNYFAQSYRRPSSKKINSNIKAIPYPKYKISLASQWTVKLKPCISDRQTLLAFCMVTNKQFNCSITIRLFLCKGSSHFKMKVILAHSLLTWPSTFCFNIFSCMDCASSFDMSASTSLVSWHWKVIFSLLHFIAKEYLKNRLSWLKTWHETSQSQV